jgi:hypothetical protein
MFDEMESQLTEAGTFPAQIYAESFFAKIPTDAGTKIIKNSRC